MYVVRQLVVYHGDDCSGTYMYTCVRLMVRYAVVIVCYKIAFFVSGRDPVRIGQSTCMEKASQHNMYLYTSDIHVL